MPQRRDNSFSVNRQFVKNPIGCQDQILFLLSVERNSCQGYKTGHLFMKTQCKRESLDNVTHQLIASLTFLQLIEFHLSYWEVLVFLLMHSKIPL